MSDGLARMPGHRSAPSGDRGEGGVLSDMLPFLPDNYDAAMPLYVSMALLFIVISRAARRKRKVRLRARDNAARMRKHTVHSVGSGPKMGRSDGHWGDG